ncbi:hypothetical protein POJ06DRAFT_149856 [Lipomyces tetrasporus]|uniref:MYND-type domain-containing protein n=1 Tax=Lipomyces tetrasporus TaxID=54092 RepID=A0AAD7VPY8_9ASCO|nr:uncharacterized protein POJ06DRAFT_149856 [Lipomyces tetrasporus]KAJ8098347.1 hypothetical protein POJ06DRAFT_149856 [Lipomyces tetrasporus]
MDLPEEVIKKDFPGRGNGLVVAKNFPAYSEIFRKVPEVSVPDSGYRSRICANCFLFEPATGDSIQAGSVAKVFSCGKCRSTYYCSRECQLQDWKAYHRRECKILGTLAPQVPPSTVILLMRILLMQGDKRQRFYSAMETLKSHIDDRRKTEDFETLVVMSKGAKEYSGTELSLEAVVEMLCKIMTNSFSIPLPTYDIVGIIFDTSVSLINHSCDPNAVIVFDKNMLMVRAVRPIKKGEEIYITYTDNAMPMPRRKEALRTQYFFDCQCTACCPPSLKPDPRNDFLCPTCGTPFQPYVTKPHTGMQLYTDIKECSSCCYEFPDPPNVVYNIERKIANTGLAEVFGIKNDGMPREILSKMKELYKLKTIPIYRSPFIEPLASLIPYYIKQADWDMAIGLIGVEYFLQDEVRSRQPEYAPVRLAHMMRFVVVLLYVILTGECSETLQQYSIDFRECLWGLVVELERLIPTVYGKNSAFENHIRENYKHEMLKQMGPVLARIHMNSTLEKLGWYKEMDKIKTYAMNFLDRI